jgi:multiple sugar transport system permease protein
MKIMISTVKDQTLPRVRPIRFRWFRRNLTYFIFLAPWLLGFIIWTGGPLIASIYLSLTQYDIMTPPKWLGLGNYRTLFADNLFWQALKVTTVYTFLSVPLSMLASLGIAVLLNQKVPGLGVFRTIFYLPTVTTGVAVALLWVWMLQPDFGLINNLLWSVFHIRGPSWLYDENWVIPALILKSLWGLGGPMLIYLAALQGIPTQLTEAAELDGANVWQRFWSVTLPMISPVILFNLVMGIIGSFQVFTDAYVMTKGGPNYASYFYVYYLYQNAFQFFKMGFASAQAWVLFLIILVFTALTIRSSSIWVYYESGGRGGA